jgi:two-component sensor histidine kinase
MKIFQRLINIGVSDDLDSFQSREVKLLNVLALVIVIGVLIGTTNYFFHQLAYPLIAQLAIAFLAMFIYVFNYHKKFDLSVYFFVVIINSVMIFISQFYDKSVATYLYFFPVISAVALLHNPMKSNFRTFILFFITIVSFIISFNVEIKFLKGPKFDEDINYILFIYNLYVCIFLTILLFYMLVRIVNNQNIELTALLNKEKESQQQVSENLKEKEILLAEIHHRVKNNLAVISGLLNLQMEVANQEESKRILNDARNRVMSIAMVHQKLYKNNLSKVNFQYYVHELVFEIVKSHPLSSKIEIIEELDSIEMDVSKAVPVGLIINETLTNSLKHAFNEVEKGVITIKMKKLFDSMQIQITDNGKGFNDIDKRADSSLGITLIESLVDQIDGTISFRNENGAFVNLIIPA